MGRARDTARLATALLLTAALGSWGNAAAFAGALSVTAGPGEGRWLSIGLLAGSTQPDRGLADYQWEIGPRLAWGAQALAGAKSWASGFRLWSTGSTQDMGAAADPDDPAVRLTSWELVGQTRVATVWGTAVLATAGAGLLHLGYQPDRVTIVPAGPGAPVVVELEAVNTWVASGGLALQRPLSDAWLAAVEVEHRVFELDTAHRNGDTIETGRERFGDWSARLELARRWGRLTKGSSR